MPKSTLKKPKKDQSLMRSTHGSGNGNDAGCEKTIAQHIKTAGDGQFESDWTGGQPAHALPCWNGELYFPDVSVWNHKPLSIVSVKMQQVKGSADQKLVHEIHNLEYLLKNQIVSKAILALAGRGWRWEQPAQAANLHTCEFDTYGRQLLETGHLQIVHVPTAFRCLWCSQEWTDFQRVTAKSCPQSHDPKGNKHRMTVTYVDSGSVLQALFSSECMAI